MSNNSTEQKLTRRQLAELEQKKRSKGRIIFDFIVTMLPMICYGIALMEYFLVPDKYTNKNPMTYVWFLSIPTLVYLGFWLASLNKNSEKMRHLHEKLRHRAPLFGSIYLFLAFYDYLTLKTGILMQPFLPWVNDILNIAIEDHEMLITSTLFSLRLLFLGYFSGVIAGLITGIACGYSKKIRYWIQPIIQVLGPIPTATWIPLIMILFTSLFAGSVFIVALGTWFAVTTATMTGISNIDEIFFNAAKTLGATGNQLVFKIAIPHAMPSILQGMTQGMSSACISLMIAEMMGVEAGLGWYITWAKAWAAYNKMFAAIVVICIMFNVVTIALNAIKKRALRWQSNEVK